MKGKDKFIEEIEKLLGRNSIELSEQSQKFWEDFKKEKPSQDVTENGLKILRFMQDTKSSYNNAFKAHDIGFGLEISARSVSSSMRKLITNGYVEKSGANPVVYAITDSGIQKALE